jgi:hypothetical protein
VICVFCIPKAGFVSDNEKAIALSEAFDPCGGVESR